MLGSFILWSLLVNLEREYMITVVTSTERVIKDKMPSKPITTGAQQMKPSKRNNPLKLNTIQKQALYKETHTFLKQNSFSYSL